MKYLITLCFLLSCCTTNNEIEKKADSANGYLDGALKDADKAILLAPSVKPIMKDQKAKINSAKDEIEALKASAFKVNENHFPWFKLLSCLGSFIMGVFILKMSIPVGNLTNTFAGILICCGSVSLYFWWDWIGEKFIPFLLAGLLIYKLFLFMFYREHKVSKKFEKFVEDKIHIIGDENGE